MSKPIWLVSQSAVVPFLIEDGIVKVVLITSRSSGKWGIPKGTIEKHLSPQDSAAKEAIEEAGLIGQVSTEAIAQYTYEKWKGTCQVEVFAMEVTEMLDRWDEMNQRKRAIVEASTAIQWVKPELKHVLRKFREQYCV